MPTPITIPADVLRATVVHREDLWRRRDSGACLVTPIYPATVANAPVAIVDAASGETTVIADPHYAYQILAAWEVAQQGFTPVFALAPPMQAEVATLGVHLLPALLGAEVHASGDGHANFTTWTAPLIADLADVRSLSLPDLEAHPLSAAIFRQAADIPAAWQQYLPVQIAGASPLDTAAELLGSTEFFLGFHTHPDAMRYLLDLCADAVIALLRGQIIRCRRWCSYNAAPAVYLNDLVTEFLSAEHWREFVLPCYRRIADAVGDLVVAVNAPDPAVLHAALRDPRIIGCAVHRNVPYNMLVDELAGRAVYLLEAYAFRDDFPGPTLHEGIYYNPIIPNPYRQYRELIRHLAGKVNLLVNVHRQQREDALSAATLATV